MTSAPRSARIWAQNGPARSRETSSTRTPFSGNSASEISGVVIEQACLHASKQGKDTSRVVTEEAERTDALATVHVLELAGGVPAAYATSLLADLGAILMTVAP